MVKTVPIDLHFGEMMNYAVRYALGRRTYAALDTAQYLIPLVPEFDTRTLWIMREDIYVVKSNDDLGDRCDADQWNELLDTIDEEMSKSHELMMLFAWARARVDSLPELDLMFATNPKHKTGIPNIWLPVTRNGYGAMALTILPKRGNLDQDEIRCANELSAQKIYCTVGRGWIDCAEKIVGYLSGDRIS